MMTYQKGKFKRITLRCYYYYFFTINLQKSVVEITFAFFAINLHTLDNLSVQFEPIFANDHNHPDPYQIDWRKLVS